MKLLSTYRYTVNGIPGDFEFKSEWRYDPSISDGSTSDMIAEEAAQHFNIAHGGFLLVWPLTFTITTSSGETVGVFSVSREIVPQFTVEQM